MRGSLWAVALLGFGSALLLTPAGHVRAADLAVAPAKQVIVVKKRKRVRAVRVVRDYDGTPVVVRRTHVVQVLPGGTHVVTSRIEHTAVQAVPRYYFNGQPVMPTTRPRGSIRVIAYYR